MSKEQKKIIRLESTDQTYKFERYRRTQSEFESDEDFKERTQYIRKVKPGLLKVSEEKKDNQNSSGKLIDNTFNEAELTKITINPFEAFSEKDDELHHIRIQAHDYMNTEGYDEYVSIKYTHKRSLNSLVMNNLFADLSQKFIGMLTLIEIYGCICDYFEMDGTEVYNLLSGKYQDLLKEELTKNTNFTRRELFCENTSDGFYMPEI